MAEELLPPCIRIGEYILQFEAEELGEEFEERAERELRETPEVVREAKAVLKNLLKSKISRTVMCVTPLFCRFFINFSGNF
jgi:hypothetical protein